MIPFLQPETEAAYDAEWRYCFVVGIEGMFKIFGFHDQLVEQRIKFREIETMPPLLTQFELAIANFDQHYTNLISDLRKSAPKEVDTSQPFPNWTGLEVLSESRVVVGGADPQRHTFANIKKHHPIEVDGMSWIDAAFCKHLASRGTYGKKTADELKPLARQAFSSEEHQWSLWLDWTDCPTPAGKAFALRAFYWLLQTLWEDVYLTPVREVFERFNRKKIYSLPRPISEGLTRAIAGEIRIDGQTICDSQGKPTGLLLANDLIAPAARQETMDLLTSQVAQHDCFLRVFHALGAAMFENYKNGNPTSHEIVILGGFAAFRAQMGIANKKVNPLIKNSLNLLKGIEFDLPNGQNGGGFLWWFEEPAAPGRKAVLTISLNHRALGIDAIHKFPDEFLVPIVDQKQLPSPVGRGQQFAKQRNAAQSWMIELTKHSDEYFENGSVQFTSQMVKKVCDRALIQPYSKLYLNMVEKWLEGDKQTRLDRTGGPYLEKDGDRYKLADTYQDAEQHLLLQGERRISNSKRGKASAAKKAENRKKHPRK